MGLTLGVWMMTAQRDDEGEGGGGGGIVVSDVMRTNPLTVREEDSFLDAAQAILRSGCGCVLVERGGDVVGILTEKDVVKRVADMGAMLASISAGSAMSAPIIAVNPTTSVEDALRIMSRSHIRRLPVVADGELLGLVTLEDLVLPLALKEAVLSSLVEAIRTQADEKGNMWYA